MNYNLVNKDELELWFGKIKTWLILLLSELNIEIVTYEDYESLFYSKRKINFLEYNKKTGILWCSYQHLYLDLYIDFDMNGEKITQLIKECFELVFEIIPTQVRQTMKF